MIISSDFSPFDSQIVSPVQLLCIFGLPPLEVDSTYPRNFSTNRLRRDFLSPLQLPLSERTYSEGVTLVPGGRLLWGTVL